MPKTDGEQDMEADSSAAPVVDDAVKTKVEPAKADSSNAIDEPEGSPNLVRDVYDEEKKKPAVAVSSAEGEEVGAKPDDQTPKEPDNEHYTDVPFRKHPRFRHLIAELHAHKPDAVRYRNVEKFLNDNGLAADEAANALTIFALAKTDPNKAWEQLQPFVQKLLRDAGEVLPEDLKQRVAAGEITAELAKEVSKSRATVESVKTTRTFEQQQTERRQRSETEAAKFKAANDWENDRRIKDPNFEAKFIPLQKEIAFLHVTEGNPDTPQGVEDQLKRAYKAVNDSIQTVQPLAQRRAIRPINGGQVGGNARPEYESTLDVIRANRRTA